MNNERYLKFEGPFREAARPLLESIKARLSDLGHGPFTEIEETDHDIDRGLEFRLATDPTTFVELKLTDGDEYGFKGVGLVMECSAYLCGVVWAPYNYTEDVGMTTPKEVAARIAECPVEDVALCIESEWLRIAHSESARESHAGR